MWQKCQAYQDLLRLCTVCRHTRYSEVQRRYERVSFVAVSVKIITYKQFVFCDVCWNKSRVFVCEWMEWRCCCDSPAALLLSSVVQVEEVCDRSRVVPQVLHCELRQMALTVEQMLYGVWCHSTLHLRSVVPLHTPDRHLICRWWNYWTSSLMMNFR